MVSELIWEHAEDEEEVVSMIGQTAGREEGKTPVNADRGRKASSYSDHSICPTTDTCFTMPVPAPRSSEALISNI